MSPPSFATWTPSRIGSHNFAPSAPSIDLSTRCWSSGSAYTPRPAKRPLITEEGNLPMKPAIENPTIVVELAFDAAVEAILEVTDFVGRDAARDTAIAILEAVVSNEDEWVGYALDARVSELEAIRADTYT